jgi:hypothetical protein
VIWRSRRRAAGVPGDGDRFDAYLEDIAAEGARAKSDGLLVPGAEITVNHIRSKRIRTSCA